MTNRFFNVGLTAGLVLIGTAAFAQEAAPAPSRGAIEVGLRAGFGLPFGSEGTTASDASDTKLSDDLKGIIPIQVDAGYRINPKIYVGLSFQYGFGLINTDNSNNADCNSSGFSCSASDVNVGVNAHYHFLPGQAFDPWVGLGAGYEWLSFSVSGGGQEATVTGTGFEFGQAQVGGDFQAARNLGIGPFASFSFGQYGNANLSQGGSSMDMSITSKSFHEWLELGVRGVYDIGL